MTLDEIIKSLKQSEGRWIVQLGSDVCAAITSWLIELRDRRESELRPATKYLSNTIMQQFSHINSEVFELKCALFGENENATFDEIVDIQMSCETLLTILGADEQQRMEARRRVIAKNKARGYYQEKSV